MNRSRLLIVPLFLILFFRVLTGEPAAAQQNNSNQGNTAKSDTALILKYPIRFQWGYPFSMSRIQSPLFLAPPSNYKYDIQYQPKDQEYKVEEKIGDFDLRPPYYMNFDEYRKYDFNRAVHDYWRERVKGETFESQKGLIPKLYIGGEAFDRIFGSNAIHITPQGSADLSFGIKISKTDNPALPEKVRKNTTFDFNNNIQMNVTGQIGDKLELGISYNTKATFDFENKTKIAYTGKDDEIIKKIEAGNVNLPLSGSLITGSQSLFGIKTALQFGRLTVTSVISQQEGQTSTIDVQGGGVSTDFEIHADEYEANKHFFLSQYFRDIYDSALKTMPVINSGINITKVEVWVTNKTNKFDNSRNIVAFMDLAEGILAGDTNLYNTTFVKYNPPGKYPNNDLNDLYRNMVDNYSGIRDISQVTSVLAPLASYGFVGGQDYEKIENARKLGSKEYTINTKLGYISLNQALNADEILAVAYEYTVGGQVFRVGEFSNQLNKDEQSDAPALILKLLKGTNLTPALPTWELMMKNIYSLGTSRLNKEEFEVHILYQNDKTGTAINYIPEGAINGEILLRVLNLDNLNNQLDPQPDGVFDFVDQITVNAQKGKIIFPVLEPFGSYLRKKIIGNDPANAEIADRYVFEELYRETQSVARQQAEKNKFILQGSYRSSSSSEIRLNKMNVAQGSVVVTAGGMKLAENVDYTVDYLMGTVKIINQGLLESGTPIKISLEDQATFRMQSKSMLGTHLEYAFNRDFNIGATILHLRERPLTNKVDLQNIPVANTIWGFNSNYRSEVPWLTRAIDWLPLIETKAKSTINFSGEFAYLIPGHSRLINNPYDKEGQALLDDFEGSETSYTLKQRQNWVLASTPLGQPDLFPEAELSNNLAYGYNRAKLAWYHIDPLFLRNNSATPSYIANNPAEQSSHFVREIQEQEIFPYKESPNNIPTYIQVLNLAYYPQERGPYNYDAGGSKYSAGVNADGKLRAPQSRWAGIMSKLQTNDFEAANVEYLEFWLMDPYVEDEKNNTVRDDRDPSIFFDLGNISEDVLKDGRKAFENGLPTSDDLSKAYIDTTVWGRVPAVQSFVNAFDNDVQARKYQDIGLDGLSDENERTFFAGFLDSLQQIVNPASQAYLSLLDDPSSDDFHYFRGDDYDQEQLGILDRYKKYNGLDGNSPTPDQTAYPTQSSNLPDVEDINHDNTLSESESYYQYKVSLRKEDFVVGRNYITDAIVGKNDQGEPVTWYQFKVPIYEPQKVIGGIQDFKSIRFIRMFLTGFGEPVILRLASLDLVRGEWRKYNLSLLEGAEQLSTPEYTRGKFEIFSVNIEENGNRYPVNYVLPPGIARITDPNNPQMIQKNEQSIAFKVTDLEDGDARAAYINKSIDMRQFKRLRLFTHAEAINEDELQNGDLRAFIRVGSDYTQNYYEYEIPLVLTPHLKPPAKYQADLTGRELVWPDVNEFNIELKVFQQVKQLRNDEIRKTDSHVTLENIFEMYDGNNRVSVVGNPNLSNVKTIMIGVRNPSQANNLQPDDGLPKSGIIWMNELRLTEFDESGGWAANARMNVKLADLGSLSVATGGSVPGFGSIDKKVQQRSREEIFNYDVSSSLQLGRLFPQKAGVNLPVFVGLSEMKRNPQYNPLDPDIPLQAALDNAESREERDSIIYISQDYTRRRSINITNVRIDPKTKSRREPKIYDIGNWSVSYSYSEALSRNIKTEQNLNRNYNMVLSYIYNDNNSKPWEPFKKSTALNKPAFRLIRDFNLFYKPSMMRFQTNLQRQYNEIRLRNISNPYLKIDPTYNKNFYWNRLYDFKWDLSRNLKLDFSAQNVARVDEPDGSMNRDEPDFKQKRDSIWNNLLAFGRTTKYHHTINAQYNIPINKIPLFDWIQSANLTYRTDFDWSAGPITPDTIILGNTVQNNSTLQMNGSLSLQKLYNKVGFLKKIDDKFKRRASGGAKKQTQTVTFTAKNISLKANKPKLIIHDLMTEDVTAVFYDQTQRVVNVKTEIVNNRRIRITADKDVPGGRIEVTGNAEVKQNPLIFIAENTAHLLMGIKSVSVNYSTDAGTMLPGFLPVAQWLGMRSVDGTMAPGWGFIMGKHDPAFGDYAAAQGWLTTDSTLNQAYMDQSRNSLQFRASIEPVSDLRIEVTASRAMSQNVEQFYIYHEDGFSAENTMFTGNFSMSFFSLKTAFENPDANNNYASASWEQFKNNRVVISKRLGQRMLNGQVSGSRFYDPNNGDVPGYADGFGPTSQEVLIPAFLAAYSGKDAGNVSLNPMPGILSMMPNWRIDYRGLQRTDWAKRIFKNLSISHSYRSTYSVGSFTTNLYWDPDEVDGLNYIRDLQFNFLPEREIGGISISEQMSPLISLDAQLQNSFMLRVEIVKSRNMTLSLNNNQLMENRSDEFRLGGGYRFQQVPISIKAGGTKRSFQSDLDLRLDLSIRDNRMIMRKLEEDVDKLTSGQRAITLKFTADYVLSSRFNLRFFYDQVINHPFVTLSYPTSNTKIGFNLRFTLTN